MSKEHLMGEEIYSYEYHFTKQEIDEFAAVMAEKCKQVEKLEAEKKPEPQP